MSRSTLWWMLFLVPIVLLVVAAFLIESEVAESKLRYERAKAELVARGEPLSASGIAPKRNPESEARARALIAACEALGRPLKDQKVRRLNLVQVPNEQGNLAPILSRETPLLSGDPKTTMTWAEVEAAHKALSVQLQRVRKLARQPEIEIHPDYELGVRTVMIGIDEIGSAANPIATDAYFALRSRDAPRVIEDIETLLLLSNVTQKQRSILSLLVSSSIQDDAWRLTWSLLGSKICSMNDLSKLREIWQLSNLSPMLAPALRGERAMVLPAFKDPDAEELFSIDQGWLGVPALEYAPNSLNYFLWRAFFRYEDAFEHLSRSQSLIDATERSQRSGTWSELLNEASKIESSPQPRCPVSNLVFSGMLGLSARMVLMQAQTNMTFVVIALEQYALVHGDYPESLSALSPEFLDETPPDPVDNQPMRYKKNNDGTFLLYSIGGNGVDDSGDATAPKGARILFKDRKDFVWPGISPPKKEASRPRIVPKKFVRRIPAATPTPAQRAPQNP